MKNIFAKISLKRIFSLFTFATIGLLLLVIFFAGKQYLLYRHCGHLVDSSQNLLFQFTGIKEHINETLLRNKSLKSAELIKEIQNLDHDLNLILEDVLIPEEFKLNFISQVDLVNVTVSLRNIENNTETQTLNQQIQITSQLRNIHSKLTTFHQLITRYTQTQLLGLHRALAGLLAIIIALVSIMLMVINQYITSPIIHYCRALFPDEGDNISLFTLHKAMENMATRPERQTERLSHQNISELARLYRFSSIGNLLGGISNELTNRSNGILNYTQAILDISDDLQLDHDTKLLLQKLFREEKKMSQQLTHMIQFTSGSENGAAKNLSLNDMFSHITALVQGTLKNDRITLTVQMDDPARTLNYHVSDLQLVILSALQSSRGALNSKNDQSGTEEAKQIAVSFDDEMIEKGRVRISIEDNGAPWNRTGGEKTDASKRGWHNMSFCNDFLQTFGGSLQVTREADRKNRCVIDIPFREKAMDAAPEETKETL